MKGVSYTSNSCTQHVLVITQGFSVMIKLLELLLLQYSLTHRQQKCRKLQKTPKRVFSGSKLICLCCKLQKSARGAGKAT